MVNEFESASVDNKRKDYRKYTAQERYNIGKYSAEFGNTAAVRHFKLKGLNELNESTLRGLKNKYQVEIKNKVEKYNIPESMVLNLD